MPRVTASCAVRVPTDASGNPHHQSLLRLPQGIASAHYAYTEPRSWPYNNPRSRSVCASRPCPDSG